MNKNIFLTFAVICCFFSAVEAQTSGDQAVKKIRDSLMFVAISDYAMKYPILRQGFLATDIIPSSDVSADLNGKELYHGKVNTTRIRGTFNVPLSQWGKNVLAGTISYSQQRSTFNKITSYNTDLQDIGHQIDRSTVGITLSYSRSDSLFNHAVNYSASLSGLTDELSSIKRLNYLGSIVVPLKRTASSSFSVGLILIIDKYANIPVIPVVSYWHKFKFQDLELFADMPQRVMLRKEFSKRASASLGSELGNTLFFFEFNQPALSRKSVNSTLEFRSGATFEYLLTKKLIIGANAGILSTVESRMFDSDDKPNDYFLNTKNGSVPYMSFTLSFLPFLKPLK